jgi:hypothetical protein
MPDREFFVITRHTCTARVTGDGTCLENLLTEQLRDFTPAVPARHKQDRTIFAGPSIVAVIRKAPDGSAIVSRFDS